jgi:hypothetical protein
LPALPIPGDERYRWLNDVVCTLTGEVQPRSDGERVRRRGARLGAARVAVKRTCPRA